MTVELSLSIVRKLEQLRDGEEVEFTREEWDLIQRSYMIMKLLEEEPRDTEAAG